MIVNISIEDLDPKFNNLDLLYEMVDNFPEIKFDIFIPVNSNWWLKKQRIKYPNWTNDILKHPEWCKKIINLPKKNFEIGIHGYAHNIGDINHGIPEFLTLNKIQAKKLLLKCEQTFTEAGIPFIRGFRPPQWVCSKGTIEALEDLNYLFNAPNLDEKIPSSLITPQIYFNIGLDGTRQRSPFSRNKYLLFRGHYDIATWPLLKNYKYIIKFLKNLQQTEKLEFKFYTEIAKDIKFESLFNYDYEEIRWGISKGDNDFFESCKNKLKEYPIKTLLDIGCGKGEFIRMCNKEKFEAFGIDPITEGENIYKGTFNSLINAKFIPNVDCVTIHNILHGKGHSKETIQGLFNFFKKHSKYIVISEPKFKKLNLPILTNEFELLYVFLGSHGKKSVVHKLYKIEKDL